MRARCAGAGIGPLTGRGVGCDATDRVVSGCVPARSAVGNRGLVGACRIRDFATSFSCRRARPGGVVDAAANLVHCLTGHGLVPLLFRCFCLAQVFAGVHDRESVNHFARTPCGARGPWSQAFPLRVRPFVQLSSSLRSSITCYSTKIGMELGELSQKYTRVVEVGLAHNLSRLNSDLYLELCISNRPSGLS